MTLTDSACKNAKPKDKTYRLSDSGALYLEITPSGGRYWRQKYRFNGKEKKLAHGTYPDVPLAMARDKRDAARRLLAQDIDPGMKKREDKQRALLDAENTFEAVARDWHAHQAGVWSDRYAKEVMVRFERDVFPAIGNLPVNGISGCTVLDAVRRIEKRGANEIAHRALQNCGQVFSYAVASGIAENDPTFGVRRALKPTKPKHFRALEAKHIPGFVHALNSPAAKLTHQTRLAIRLLMLTFVRTNELIQATWSEFDLDAGIWMIPAHRMKRRKDHIVPLSRQAIAALRELRHFSEGDGYIFPSKSHPRKHMSENTMLAALQRLEYEGRTTGHGFRSLAMSTIKEKLGYRHEVIDRQLAHCHRNKVDAAYDRAEFLDQRTVMMQRWADHIDDVSYGTNIVRGAFGQAA